MLKGSRFFLCWIDQFEVWGRVCSQGHQIWECENFSLHVDSNTWSVTGNGSAQVSVCLCDWTKRRMKTRQCYFWPSRWWGPGQVRSSHTVLLRLHASDKQTHFGIWVSLDPDNITVEVGFLLNHLQSLLSEDTATHVTITVLVDILNNIVGDQMGF